MIDWLTLEELSHYLKVSRAFLYKEAQSGRIPAAKVGRSWRFDRSRIDRWIQEGERADARMENRFPWSDCLDIFLKTVRDHFGQRFHSLWIYGSWARGDSHPDSDVDLMVVLKTFQNREKERSLLRDLAYEATFGRDRLVVFSVQAVDERSFREDMAPLLMNIRKEGRQAA